MFKTTHLTEISSYNSNWYYVSTSKGNYMVYEGIDDYSSIDYTANKLGAYNSVEKTQYVSLPPNDSIELETLSEEQFFNLGRGDSMPS